MLFGKKSPLGDRICKLREDEGMSQEELAAKLQVSPDIVKKWEKGSATPDIEQFPQIAKLFNVTIDYIMTGKKAEEQVLLISKIEYCAKTDNPSMLDEIDVQAKDENGKTLWDYIQQYNSYKVLSAVLDKNKNYLYAALRLSSSLNNHETHAAEVRKYIMMLLNLNKIQVMERQETLWVNGVRSLLCVDDKNEAYRISRVPPERCVLTSEQYEAMVMGPHLSDETFNYLLDTINDGAHWAYGFPYLIHECVEHGLSNKLDRLLSLAESDNRAAYDELTNRPINRDRPWNVPDVTFGYYCFNITAKRHTYSLIWILKSTYDLALERGQYDLIKRFDTINTLVNSCNIKCHISSKEDIRIAQINQDTNMSSAQKIIQRCIHDGVLSMNELTAAYSSFTSMSDYEEVKAALDKYPLTQEEHIQIMINSKAWKELFIYAVDHLNNRMDNVYKNLATCAINEDYDGCKKWYYGLYRRNLSENCRSTENATAFLDKLYLHIKLQGATSDLNKDFFTDEMNKGNYELVIIKLCVLLESYLKCVYNYEGDLIDMIDDYCKKVEHNPENQRLLNKLRMSRNKSVHYMRKDEQTSNSNEMTKEELKSCINYICRLTESV